MKVSPRFLNLVRQQLASFSGEKGIHQIVVYVAQPVEGGSPSLDPIHQWPIGSQVLLPVEEDPELTAPSPCRRWYPLQEGSLLLGVIRAELLSPDQVWPENLDSRLQATASGLAQCLSSEIDRRRLIRQLNEQREQIGLMVHQLRNPLAALRTYAQLLMRRLGSESIHKNLVEGLLVEQEQLNKYISALDELSERELPSSSSPVPLLLPPVVSKSSSACLRSLIEPLIERASAMASLQDREWNSPSYWPNWTKVEISSDYWPVREIVANLLENAFRYSPKSSSIGLQFDKDSLCVWDSGEPIDQKDSEKIFKKGFRGKKSINDNLGSGLGLSLGRQLAESIGGELELIASPKLFERSLPSKGNAFVLSLKGTLKQK